MFYNFLNYIWLLLNFITTTFCLYHMAIALAAFRKQRHSPAVSEKKNRFAAIIAARNEGNVIGSLIESIKLQNYPAELIDVIVVADNCDDNTAEIAQKAGAVVYKRFNKAEIGKGYVVKFALEKILAERDYYDAYCILDADNVADKDFFLHMNESLCSGASVAQGYRDMKNATDNWVSGCHSIFYWMENRFYNFSRSYLGLSASVNGTGFMITRDYVKKYGFNMKTITEDLELTTQCVINGYRVAWVPQAKVYDEQPLTVQQSMRQRQRWTTGFLQCFTGYFKELVASCRKKPSWVKFDMLMFLFSLPTMLIGTAAMVMYAIFGLLCIFDPISVGVNLAILFAASIGAFWIIGLLSVVFEKKNMKSMLIGILTYPIFNISWTVLYAQSFIKRKIEWKPIVHARNIGINEIEQGK